MATTIPLAVIELYETISESAFGGTRPPIYFDQAPQTGGDSAALQLPYVLLFDEGFRPEFFGKFDGVEKGEIRLEIYAAEAETTATIGDAILWGGGAPGARDGLDFGELPLTGYRYKVNLMRTYDRTRYTRSLARAGQRVHVRELRYQITFGIKPA
jgi:hypothetical protein